MGCDIILSDTKDVLPYLQDNVCTNILYDQKENCGNPQVKEVTWYPY